MQTIADFKRAAIPGSRWLCINTINPQVSGLRTITKGKTVLSYDGVSADGSTIKNGRVEIPKAAACRIDGDTVTFLDDDGSVAFAWTRVPIHQSDEQVRPPGFIVARPWTRELRGPADKPWCVYDTQRARVCPMAGPEAGDGDGAYFAAETEAAAWIIRHELAPASEAGPPLHRVSTSGRDLPPPGETDPVARWKLLGQVSVGPGGPEHQARWARYVLAIRRVHGLADDAIHDEMIAARNADERPWEEKCAAYWDMYARRMAEDGAPRTAAAEPYPVADESLAGDVARETSAQGVALARRVEGYAAKFVAETASAEPPRRIDPTDQDLAATFANCARVPNADEYPAIREAIGRLLAQRAADTASAAEHICPASPDHGLMVRRDGATLTDEQRWCGTWYDCAASRCSTSVLVQSDELRQHLAAQGNELTVVSGPYAPMPGVRYCDVGGERLGDQQWWLVKATGRGWEGDHGAACAKHKGRTKPREWQPQYEPWRHGGWYVTNVRYPSGACGCVSRNYADKKWRIVCDPRGFENGPTFPNRDAAARAEREVAAAQWAAANQTPAPAEVKPTPAAEPEAVEPDPWGDLLFA